MSQSVDFGKTFALEQRMISSRFLPATLKIVDMISATDTFVLLNAIRELPVQSILYFVRKISLK